MRFLFPLCLRDRRFVVNEFVEIFFLCTARSTEKEISVSKPARGFKRKIDGARSESRRSPRRAFDKVARSLTHERYFERFRFGHHINDDDCEHGSHRWAGSLPSESPRLLRLFLCATLQEEVFFFEKNSRKKSIAEREVSTSRRGSNQKGFSSLSFPFSTIAR